VPTKARSREDQICLRLKEAREEFLNISLSGFAKGVGISKDRLSSYEQCRAPLRADLALRICRRWILSEEWLATGTLTSFRASAQAHGFRVDYPAFQSLHTIGGRQCVDLFSEPVGRNIAPGKLFSEAYDTVLRPVYSDLVARFFYYPRIVFSEDPEPDLAHALASACLERWMKLLSFRTSGPWHVQRHFVARFIEAGSRLFSSLAEPNGIALDTVNQ
jgi:hypothetical protein